MRVRIHIEREGQPELHAEGAVDAETFRLDERNALMPLVMCLHNIAFPDECHRRVVEGLRVAGFSDKEIRAAGVM